MADAALTTDELLAKLREHSDGIVRARRKTGQYAAFDLQAKCRARDLLAAGLPPLRVIKGGKADDETEAT